MGMSVGGGGSEVKNEPNVVPMIDIMLVLLIIFMIVTPVITSGFQARMPEGRNTLQSPSEDGDVVLGIDADGQYYLDPGTGEIGQIPNDSLGSYLAQVFETRLTDKILFFKADADLAYEEVEVALELARDAGVRLLASITEQIRD
jgi:biopolymer transport protein TolR